MSPAKKTAKTTIENSSDTTNTTPSTPENPPNTNTPSSPNHDSTPINTVVEEAQQNDPNTSSQKFKLTSPILRRSLAMKSPSLAALTKSAKKTIEEAVARLNVELKAPKMDVGSSKGKRKRGDSGQRKNDAVLIHGKSSNVETSRLLFKLGLTDGEHAILQRVSRVPVTHGRSFPEFWYASKPGLLFFVDLLLTQSWKFIIEFTGPVYPVEVIQFYSTVDVGGDMLSATINHKEFTLSVEEFGEAFAVPHTGYSDFPFNDWGNVSQKEAKIIQKTFSSDPDSPHFSIATSSFSAETKFLYNFVLSTLTPRKHGRNTPHIIDLIVMYHLIKGHKVNLPKLVFSVIKHECVRLREGKGGAVMAYGVWLSYLFKKKGVLNEDTYGVQGNDVMSDKLFGQMCLGFERGRLIRTNIEQRSMMKELGIGLGVAVDSVHDDCDGNNDEGVSGEKVVEPTVKEGPPTGPGEIHPDLVAWMKAISTKLEAQSHFSNKVVEPVLNQAPPTGPGEIHPEMLAWMEAICTKLEAHSHFSKQVLESIDRLHKRCDIVDRRCDAIAEAFVQRTHTVDTLNSSVANLSGMQRQVTDLIEVGKEYGKQNLSIHTAILRSNLKIRLIEDYMKGLADFVKYKPDDGAEGSKKK